MVTQLPREPVVLPLGIEFNFYLKGPGFALGRIKNKSNKQQQQQKNPREFGEKSLLTGSKKTICLELAK